MKSVWRSGVVRMLEGKTVNLRVVEKEDLPLIAEWRSDPKFQGEYDLLIQESKADLEKRYGNFRSRENWFLIEKKDGTKIGMMVLEPGAGMQEIGYGILPNERGKGYCTDAVKILVDYLFLSEDIVRVQTHADVKNMASQKVLARAGFRKEGVVRKHIFMWGEWRDELLYSILREEWGEPRVLTRKEPR
jgi:RimJ/RimL family protein N-acetyltransferase